MKSVDSNALVVLEDIDALFNKEREKKEMVVAITFSGMLNALDGVGEVDGQIIMMTTNYRDRLEPALIRPGRVDVHVPFEHADSEQMKLMFQHFLSQRHGGGGFSLR